MGTLKALRLTHRNFANLRHINEVLFRSVKLLPTPKGLENVERLDMSRILNYVKRISFVSPRVRSLEYETFAKVVKGAAIHKRIEELTAADRNPHYDDSMREEFLKRHFGGKEPFIESQLHDGVDSYKQNGQVLETLFGGSDQRIKEAWTKVLKNVRDRHTEIRCYTDNYVTKRMVEEEAKSTANKVHAGPDFDRKFAHEATKALAGTALFATAMSCVAASELKLHSLEIDGEMTGEFNWEAIPGWDKLDLSSLQKIEFMPRDVFTYVSPGRVPESIQDLFPVTDPEYTSKRACKALGILIDGSRDSLRTLIVQDDAGMSWPDRPASKDLPLLESLCSSPSGTEPTFLASWIARMPRLGDLEVAGSLAGDTEYERLVDILDAVRDHPRALAPEGPGIHLVISQIQTNNWTTLSWEGMVHRKYRDIAERPSYIAEEFERAGDYDIDLALESHLIYAEPYSENRALRAFLEADEED